ncbi:Ig-like domain-containing protein [Rhizobium rhizosphaerae]|uniref:Ig-like domain-containing protein n=1 Tax=Xaviernesmea rhizosphaerae TaxID=1672749 RepID=UPI001FD8F172|nr:Ig-like domain-containing protein [Xaviernesmea rhizosphaerae]
MPALSGDGTKLLFRTSAGLVPEDSDGGFDFYVKDLTSGALTLVGRAADGTVANSASLAASISADGTKIAFWSQATNLVANDTNGLTDLFVKDLVTGAVTLVTQTADGVQANRFSNQDLTTAFSPDGNFLLFTSLAGNLVPGDTNNNFDLFVKDLRDGTITRVSTAADGTQANFGGMEGRWSPDGRSIVFYSGATNLVSGPDGNNGQLFVKDVSSLYPAPTNHAPVANADSFTVVSGTPLQMGGAGVLANDVDIDGDPLHAVLLSGPAHGTLNLDASGAFTYAAETGFHGADSFTYKANDGTADSASATVTLLVDQAPVSTGETYTMRQDKVLTVSASAGVLANDTDADGDPLTASLITGPQHGTLSLAANGGFTYTPTAGYHGADSFTYRANDGTTNGNVATVNLQVYSDAGKIVRVSTTSTGAELLHGGGYGILTPDGSKVLLQLLDKDLEPNAPNGQGLYIKDLATGDLSKLVDTFSEGNHIAPEGFKLLPNGTAVVYSNDSGLFTLDLQTRVQRRIGPPTADFSISPDGTRIAYYDGTYAHNIYVLELGSGTTTLISSKPDGTAQTAVEPIMNVVPFPHNPGLGDTRSYDRSLSWSSDGTKVAFSSYGQFIDGQNNPYADVYIKDLTTGGLELVSAAYPGWAEANDPFYSIEKVHDFSANGTSMNPVFSPDGSKLAFVSYASNILQGGTANSDPKRTYDIAEIYIKDLRTGQITLASTAADGTPGFDPNPPGALDRPNLGSYHPEFSPDGTKLVFGSTDTNLVSGGTPIFKGEYYVKDLQTGAISLVSTDVDGNAAAFTDGPFDISSSRTFNAGVSAVHFSADGSKLIFSSNSANLVPNDTNKSVDIFLKTIHYPPTANEDRYSPPFGKPFIVSAREGVLKNDVSTTGDPLTATLVAGPAQGTLDFHADGSFTYTPPTGPDALHFTGKAEFSYKVNDGNADSSVAKVTLQNPSNSIFSGLGVGGGRSSGDPHLMTFDGHAYDFQAAGEFTLVKGPDFEIQVRQSGLAGGHASVNTAVAMSVDGTAVSLYAGRNHPLLIGGVATDLGDGDSIQVGNGSVTRQGSAYVVTNGNGDGFYAALGPNVLEVQAMLGSSGRAISGLLGNADGSASNDFRLRDGTDLGEAVASATLYSTFADSWRITDATSLFTYGAGESTASFTDRSFPHAIVTLADLDPTVRAAAEQTARDAGLTPGTLTFDNAVLDVALTGNAEFATSAAALPVLKPDAPRVALAADTGASNADGLTKDAALAMTPSASAGRLSVTVDGHAVATYDPSSLSQGTHTVSVTETNALGYRSDPTTVTFTLDSQTPDLQVTTGGGRSVSSDILVSGTIGPADIGRQISIFDETQTLLGTTVATADGRWSLTVQVPQMGDHQLTATAMDVAGNTAQVSFAITRANDPGSGLGDVHMKTFQGLSYDFQAVGRFTMVRSVAASNPFDIQIETKSWGDLASVTDKIAAQIGGNAVRFELDGSIFVNGAVDQSLSSDGKVLHLDGGAITRLSAESYRVDWSSGESLSVTNQGVWFDEVASLGPSDGPGSVEGLLGSNTSRATDIALADGTVLEHPTEADLLGRYAESWSLPKGGSLLENGGTLPIAFSDRGKADAPFNGRSSIDLANFVAERTTLAFEADRSGAFGTLTVASGQQQTALILMGQYAATNFHAGNDGHGGVTIDYQPPRPTLLG